MTIVYTEYENQHQHRKYPFVDNASMVSTDGTPLPVGYILDAFLYPFDLVGGVYLASLDTGSRVIIFADTANGTVCGKGTWEEGDQVVHIYGDTEFERRVGIVLLGESAATFSGKRPLSFIPTTAQLTPTAFVPLTQVGVRGFILPSGQLVTGAVTWEGRNGVVITSTVQDTNEGLIRIDIMGQLPSAPEECNTPACTGIDLVNDPCAPIIGSGTGNIIRIVGYNFTLSDLCAAPRLPDEEGNLPVGDVCEDPPVFEPVDPCHGPGVASNYLVTPEGGRIAFVAPSTLAGDNPVSIRIEDAPSLPVRRPTGDSLAELDKQVEDMLRISAQTPGRLILKLRGPIR